jgi:Domain of unknown function (DUF4124)
MEWPDNPALTGCVKPSMNTALHWNPMTSSVRLSVFAVLWLASALAWGQIYTCIDAKGRKLTSDRPIPECAEREQKELNSSGTLKRTVKPVMTAEEQRVSEEKEKQATEERLRLNEEKRKDRALLTRYPNRASHDKERADTLAQVDDVMKAATKRIGELAAQRKEIDTELEFYKKNPTKIPLSLKRQIEDNDASVAVQKRFIADQESEKKRTNARFDDELLRLKTLWLLTAAPAATTAPKK